MEEHNLLRTGPPQERGRERESERAREGERERTGPLQFEEEEECSARLMMKSQARHKLPQGETTACLR